MDTATLVGIIAGLGLAIGAVFLGPAPGKFLDLPGLMIVLGGTWAAGMAAFSFADVRQAVRAGIRVFASRGNSIEDATATMVRIAEISRKEGLLALENIHTPNPVLKKAVELIAGNAEPELIRDTLAIEILSMKRRHNVAVNVFMRLATFAPAVGMLGTLIGLMQMLGNLKDPDALGHGMAVALLAAFYGCLLSTLVFLPVAGRLKARSMQEEQQLTVIFEGARCILENNNPRLVHEKLSSFLPPKDRVRVP